MQNRKIMARNKLFKAIEKSDYTYIKDYLEKGFNINCKNRDGYTGVHKAIFADDTEMVRFLIQNGALINDMSCHYASAMGRKEIIKILVEYGVNINNRDYSGRTPLHWACQEGYTDIVDLLVENGAQMSVQEEEDGQTPLYIASAEGHYNIVKQLLEKGVEVDVPSILGTTPFGIACAFENYREAELLLNYGANINYKDKDGRTPLFYAKVRKNPEMIKFLHDNNAENNVIDNYGITILDLDDEKIREKLFKELY